MSNGLWRIGVFLIAMCSAWQAAAQAHNLAYYEKIGEHDDWTIYQVKESRYLSGLEDERMWSGDAIIVWGDGKFGGCDGQFPDPQLCPDGLDRWDEEVRGFGIPGSIVDNGIPRLIKVMGQRPNRYMVVIQTQDGATSGADFSEGILRPVFGSERRDFID